MAEIGQVSGLGKAVTRAGVARNERAANPPAQPRPINGSEAPRQVRLPAENAVREVARGIADYIVSNRLTVREGYQAFTAEITSDTAWTLLSSAEMELIEKLAQGLASKASVIPADAAATGTGTLTVGKPWTGLTAAGGENALQQMPGAERMLSTEVTDSTGGTARINLTPSGASVLSETGGAAPSAWASQRNSGPLLGLGQEFTLSWSLNGFALRGAGDGLTSNVLPRDGALAVLLAARSASAMAGNDPANGSPGSMTSPASFPALSESGRGPELGGAARSAAAPATEGMPGQQGATGSDARSGQSSISPVLLRVDLREVLGGKAAELRIRYDEALIASKVAVLLEQMSGLVRICEEQERSALHGRQKASPEAARTLRQVLAAALGIFIEGNKTFNTPGSVGISAGRDGMLLLDPTVLKNALESNREETGAVLKSLATSFYDNIGLFVDPRILARFAELIGHGEAERAGRSGKEGERRWKKEKDSLEKRFLELGLVIEESGKLREWFMNLVETSGPRGPDPEPLDEVEKRVLPAIDLLWDQEEIPADRSEEVKESTVRLFIARTVRALQEEDCGASIKILLKRKLLSDKLLSERPGLEPKTAMVCLANEELLLGRLEAERTKLLKNLDELSRTMTAARGYRSQFPFPPPMAAFVESEG